MYVRYHDQVLVPGARWAARLLALALLALVSSLSLISPQNKPGPEVPSDFALFPRYQRWLCRSCPATRMLCGPYGDTWKVKASPEVFCR